MENMIDNVTVGFRENVLKRYDELTAATPFTKKGLSNEDRIDLAIAIVCADVLNNSTVGQIYSLRKNGYLLF